MLSFPPYNYILHTSPLDSGDHQYYHWHFEIMPTIVRVAGFEWGTGFYINPTPPGGGGTLSKGGEGLASLEVASVQTLKHTLSTIFIKRK